MGFDAEDFEEVINEKPFCKVHFCEMERYKTKRDGKKYYRCKVKGCTEKHSVAPQALRLPVLPTLCPICSSAMEVEKIGPFFVSMVCRGKLDCGLDCGHKHEFARPDINRQIKKVARKADILDSF